MTKKRMTRMTLPLALLAALFLSACSGSAPAEQSAAPAKETAAAAAEKKEEKAGPKETAAAEKPAEAPAETTADAGKEAGKTDDRPSDMIDGKDVKVGSVVVFGSYEQDGDEGNGPEPVDWVVLANDGGNLFLLSRYALDAKPFHSEGRGTWDVSSLRTWLNGDFYETVFSGEEQALVQTTKVTADPNPQSKMEPGTDTEDKVFLLSTAEAEEFFPSDRERQCWSTPYAVSQGAYTDEPYELTDSWLLRSPGGDLKQAACVYYNGAISYTGATMKSGHAVRPAVRVSGGTWRVLKDGTDERQLQMAQDEADAFSALGKVPEDASGRAFDQAAMAAASAGSAVNFGAFEQDGDTGNGAEPIEWIVAENDGGALLLVSRYALDCRPYHVIPGDITWEKSTLRAWLNSDFYNAAFSEAERAQILTTEVPAAVNPDYESDPGNATQDKVFIQSAEESLQTFGPSKTGEEMRSCYATPYAKAQGAQTRKKDDLRCYFWLRDPSRGTAGRNSSFAATVDAGGAIRTASNHCGGILGGISSGMPILMRVTLKPTPSIALEQRTVSLSTRTPAALTVGGRHDPCIVPRASVVVEAAAALALVNAE